MLPNYGKYACCEFAVDSNRVYVAGFDAANSQVNIWGYDFANHLPLSHLFAPVGEGIEGVIGMDVDDGWFVINLRGDGPSLLLLDPSTQTYELDDPGISFFHVEILRLD